MKPPSFSLRILLWAVPRDLAECIVGDLTEEFGVIASERGEAAARRWYSRQVWRSLLPLASMRAVRGELPALAAVHLGLLTLPLLLLDRLWTFVYTQIPLRGTLERSWELLAANIVCAACLCAVSVRAGGGVAAASAACAIAVMLSTSSFPLWYLVVLFALPAVVHRLWAKKGNDT